MAMYTPKISVIAPDASGEIVFMVTNPRIKEI